MAQLFWLCQPGPWQAGGKLDFGPWEQIFYEEFDGRRRKLVLVKIIGDLVKLLKCLRKIFPETTTMVMAVFSLLPGYFLTTGK